MQIELAYGKTGLTVDLPDSTNVTVVEPSYVEGLPDQAAAVREALRGPIASPPLRELVQPADTVGIAFSDITRATPYPVILPVLLDELSHVPDERIVLFNATGTHRANTEDELRAILGEGVVGRYRIVQHDARDRDSHLLVGTTAGGNEVWVHGEFVECDVRIPTGFIEPHFFAGFSGGPKAIVPGLALLETVMHNHSARHMDSPRARWGITCGNPLWEDLHEAAAFTGPAFMLNVALNRDKAITAVFAGDLDQAHARGCAYVQETAMAPVEARFDIVIASNSGYPLDLNLYQSVKGMSAAAQVVKTGGSIIVAADCWDGIPDHGEYSRLLREAASPQDLLEMVRAPDFRRQDAWQAHIQALICLRAGVYFYSHNLSDDQIESGWLRPCRDVKATLGDLLEKHGPHASVCVLPEGPLTIPYVA